MNKILEKAESLINGARAERYGNPSDMYERLAMVWSGIFNCNITSRQCVNALAAMKALRDSIRPHEDNAVDGAGYFALIGKEEWRD